MGESESGGKGRAATVKVSGERVALTAEGVKHAHAKGHKIGHVIAAGRSSRGP